MNPLRRLLRYLLGSLAKSAIKKHNIELIVIAGWYNTDIARELAYTVLNDKLKVRRNTREVWWDFSLPLSILGYSDKRRSFAGWIILLLRASLYLTFSKSNPHTLIINADCTFEQTAKYWASFIAADYLVILNYDRDTAVVRELVNSLSVDTSTVVYNPDSVPATITKKLSQFHTVTFGDSNDCKVRVQRKKAHVQVTTANQKATLPVPATVGVTEETLGAVLALAHSKEIELTDAAFSSLKFELPGSVLAKIRTKLEVSPDTLKK